MPLAFRYRLAATLAGSVLSGSAVAGARVLVAHDQGGGVDSQLVIASASGAFSVGLGDPFPGDRIVVSAADPATHGVTTLSLIVGDSRRPSPESSTSSRSTPERSRA